MISNIKKMIPSKYKIYINKLRFPIKCIKYLLNQKKYIRICKKLDLNFYTDIDVVNEIIENKKSLCRYGDGEFLWILGKEFESYQEKSDILTNRLKEVLKVKNENLIIGLPGTFHAQSIDSYILKSRVHWVNFITKYYSNCELEQIIEKNKIYADSLISRCYIDYKDKNFTKERYSNLKRIWNKKEIVIVEGNKTKLGVGNDLFSNAKKIERIICPAKNAFAKYDDILEWVKNKCKNKITILALGPTATVLAADICKFNNDSTKIEYQAIDLGHIDIEYEWFLRGAKKRIPIEGKFVNEARAKDLSEQCLNKELEEQYKEQIIATILD